MKLTSARLNKVPINAFHFTHGFSWVRDEYLARKINTSHAVNLVQLAH